MDLATIVGLVLAMVLILISIVLGGDPIMFVNIPSLMIVVGGTIGATLMRNPLATVLGVAKVCGKAFTVKLQPAGELIEEILGMAKTARKDSLLALEKLEIENGFLAKGVSLCVDGMELDAVRAILETDIQETKSRHKRGSDILEGMGQAAPAFGMIGTLIGLVQMLATMEDPSSIGPAMAVALLTTLYGAFLSNVVLLPLADKLKVRSGEEVLVMNLCMEGILGIAQGTHPSAIDQNLKSFVSPALRIEEEKAA